MHATSLNKKRATSTKDWERLQLSRLILALILFFAVCLGKRIYPENIVSAGERVMGVLSKSTDVEAVFARLGEAMTSGEGTLEGLESFCVEVFGAQQKDDNSTELASLAPPTLPVAYCGLLREELMRTDVKIDQVADTEIVNLKEESKETIPAVGTVLTVGTTSSEDYPPGYTADELCFGQLQTITPVLGELNSGFGYRDHPISGSYSFHGGADISADAGDPIQAFACGVVEYVGEDDSYGLYVQLDHGEGIKSFYAHCQSVCVQKGEHVEIGQTVASVGATGRATGPHLHLELKCCGVRVDPAYYIEFL